MGNLSQEKRARMAAFLRALKEAHREEDGALAALSEIETELFAKKYGLVWEEHEEAVDVMMRENVPVFTECKEKEIAAAKSEDVHFLLEGDNLHSLKLLEKTHKGKVDVIYIDPPYNTKKKEFVYDDCKIGEDDSYRHSKWLSFMYERLRLAQSVLSDCGCIFISIDDNEEAQLKLLCDDIYGNENFLGVIIQNKKNAKNDSTDIQKNHEYILVYRKKKILTAQGKVRATLLKKERKMKPAFLEDGKYYYVGDAITTRGEGGILNARPNLGYTIYYNAETKDKIAVMDYDVELAKSSNDAKKIYSHKPEMIKKGYAPILPPKVRGKLGCWTWSLEKFNSEKENVVITGKSGKYAVKKRTFVPAEDIQEIDGKLFYVSLICGNSRSIIDFSTNDGTTLLTDIIGENSTFNNPKNEEMIKYLLSLFGNKNALVLDFFAGSGTTGQAVLELNREDGGRRKFILCTNNENGICENVTYPRIRTVITGKRADGSVYSEGIPANVKYFRTDFVSKMEEDLSAALLSHIAEMVELEHGVKLDGRRYLLVLSDEEADELATHWEAYPDVRALYVSREVLFTTEQTALFSGVEVHIIPDSYFQFELREAGESW